MKNLRVAAIAALSALAASAADAATYNGMTLAELTAALQTGGFPIQNMGDGVLKAGATFVWLTDCNSQSGKCAEIGFFRDYADVRPTLAAVNQWNNSKKVPEASINSDGSLRMEMWMTALGATDASIVDSLQWYERYAADVEFWKPYIKSAGV